MWYMASDTAEAAAGAALTIPAVQMLSASFLFLFILFLARQSSESQLQGMGGCSTVKSLLGPEPWS